MIQDDYDYEFPDDIDYDYDFDDDDTPKPIVKDGFVYRNEEHVKQQAQPLTYKGKPIYTEDDIKTAEIQIDKAYKRADVLHILNIIFVPYNKVFLPLWLVICIAIGKLNIFIGGVIIFGGLLHLLYIGRASRWNTYKEKLSKKKLERYETVYNTSPQYILNEELENIKKLADTVNTTISISEFEESYKELISKLEYLQSMDNLSIFVNKPSNDLKNIHSQRFLTEKKFIDRFATTFGLNHLATVGILFDNFTESAKKYIDEITDKEKRFNNELLKIDTMDGHSFEYYCADLLKQNGFSDVQVTSGSGDHGVDIFATKDNISYAIQCKCYSSNIGNKAVQEAYTAKGLFQKDVAAVMTNQYFTKQAREEAEKLNVKLWDRDKVSEFIKGTIG